MACVGCPVIPVKIALILSISSNLVVIYLILLYVVFILIIILLLYLIFYCKKKTKRIENDPQVGVVGHFKKIKN